MKRFLIALAAATLIPSIASTAVTTDKAEEKAAEPMAAVEETSAIVDLGQFSASDNTGLGAIAATVVSSPGDKGRAEAALSRAVTRARAFAMEIPSLEERLNSLPVNERIELTPETFDFLKKAKQLAALTHGWYDATAPSPKGAFLKKDWRRMKLDPATRTFWLKSDGMKFDLARLATGYAADIMMSELTDSGFANAMVEIGSVQSNKGRNIFTPWNVTIGFGEGPTDTGTYRAYRYNVGDVAAATITPDGMGRDLIDAHSKNLVKPDGIRSVTVFAHDATTATAFAISAYTLGPKHGLRYIEAHPEMMCVIVDGGGQLFASKNMNITTVPERSSVRQGSKGGPDDIKQKQREESLDQ